MTKLVGVFGGTFDPIHSGHLLLAERAQEHFNFSEIKFIPCKLPVHKDAAHATTEQRVDMIKLAIQYNSKFRLDTRELDRDTASYMIETLESLQREMPEAILCLLMGFDSFLTLPTWHRWQELMDHAHIIVVARPGAELTWPKALDNSLKQRLPNNVNELSQQKHGKLFLFDTMTQDVSSSELRMQLKRNLEADLPLPDDVLKYIRKHGLYVNHP